MSQDVDALRTRLVRVFHAEVEDALDAISNRIEALDGAAVGADDVDAVARVFHGITTTSASFECAELESLGEAVEVRLDAARDAEGKAGFEGLIALLQRAIALIRDWLAAAREGRTFDGSRFEEMIEEIGGRPAATTPVPHPVSGAVLVARDRLESLADHVAALDLAQSRLHDRADAEDVLEGLREIEHHARTLRALLREVDSQIDEGVVDVQVLRIAAQRFAVPLASLVEGLPFARGEMRRLGGVREQCRSGGRRLPVVRLDAVASDVVAGEDRLLAVLDAGGRRIALVVDELGESQSVEIESRFAETAGIVCGDVVLANGRAARALDVRMLVDAVCGVGTRQGDPRRGDPRAAAATGWKRLVRKTSNTEEASQHGRYQ